jgi:hypothetical protein
MPAISYGTPVYRDDETRIAYDALTLAVLKAQGWTDTPEMTVTPTPARTGPKKGKR